MQKVFGIGFHKTGTKSLAQALSDLGYNVTGPNGVHDADIADKVHDMADELLTQFDAFQDNPWPIIFKDVDKKCPGSKFILTIRPTDVWWKSVVRHFGGKHTPMREWIYGVGDPAGNEDIYRARYLQHNRDVMEYFANRPDDLIVMDFASGDGWEKLCSFLSKEIPNRPFPHANSAAEREQGAICTGRKRSFFKRLFGGK